MPTLTVKTASGGDSGTVELADAVFGIEPNVPVMHQVVTAQLAARRSGTQSTKTRSEVRGGGAKPWKQKGTGRARQGSIRAPHWRGGGVALGPKPRSYAQRTPKKMVRLALRSALSDRAAEDRVIVVDGWSFEGPRTKDAVTALEALGVSGRTLVVVAPEDRDTWLSFRNLPEVHVLAPGELNAYDVLVADWIVFSQATLPTADGGDDARDARQAGRTARAAAGLVREAKEARKAVTPKAAAEVPADDEVSDDTDTDPDSEQANEEEADMASDLPNRDKPSPDAKRTVIEPTDRVKSVADKEDPRFAAARKKADKEDRRRTARDKRANPDANDDVDEAEDDDEAEKPAQGFSFNNTTEPKP